MKKAKNKVESNETRTFELLDLVGNVLKAGDVVAYAYSGNRSTAAYLMPGIIRAISLCPKTVRIELSVFFDSYESSNYFSLSYEQSGKNTDKIVKIEGVEFLLDQKRFARLLGSKAETES
jgi:hypothetical protein